MCEISVIIPLYKHENYVQDAIKSIQNQSFKDFEVILTDFGSNDNSLSIVKSFNDNRFRVITHNSICNRINALNAGLSSALGRYIAIMEADHIMHVDRLKIQHAFMESEPSITVCSTHVNYLNAQIQKSETIPVSCGLLENPLLFFLRGNCIIHTTVMIRNQFLKKYQLLYENYPDTSDFKLWAEIAKRGGRFYVDTQTLLSYRVLKKQEEELKQDSSDDIINEIVEFLAEKNSELKIILATFKKLQDKEKITHQDVIEFFHHFFTKNKVKL